MQKYAKIYYAIWPHSKFDFANHFLVVYARNPETCVLQNDCKMLWKCFYLLPPS